MIVKTPEFRKGSQQQQKKEGRGGEGRGREGGWGRGERECECERGQRWSGRRQERDEGREKASP